MKYIAFLLILLLPLNSLADQVTLLDQGKPAPYKGYLFDQDKAEKVRLLNITNDSTQRINDLLSKENSIYVDRLNNYRDQNDKLAKDLASINDNGFWSKLGFFILGAAVTVGIGFSVSRATR